MTPEERGLLVERVVSAHRERSGRGELRSSPAWHDLDDDARIEAAALAATTRRLESALHPRGWSSTVAAVVGRLR